MQEQEYIEAEVSPSEVGTIDFRWLAERCGALLGLPLPVTPMQIAALQEEHDRNEADGRDPDRRGLIGRLLAMLKVQEYAWMEEPADQSLPMIGVLPGIGCRIVYGRTQEGRWLLEGPDGCRESSVIPEGSGFTPLHLKVSHSDYGPPFMRIIREAYGAKKGVFVKAGIASVMGNLFAVVISFYSLQVYDRVIPTQGVSTLIVLTIGVVMVMGVDLSVKLARSLVMEEYIKGVDHEISHGIFQRLLRVRMDQFPSSLGSLAAQIRGYESIRAFLSSATMYMLIDVPFGLVFMMVIMSIAGPAVALVSLVFFALSLTVGLAFRRRIEEHTKRSAKTSNRKLGVLVDAVDAAESIKASGASWQVLGLWDQLNRQVVEDDAKTRHYSEVTMYMTGFMQQLSYVLLVATGAWVASTSTGLTTGGIVACAILSGRVLTPISMLPGLIVQWGHAKIAYNHIEKFFTLETDNFGVERPLRPGTLRGAFQVNGLRFGYPGQPRTVAVDRLEIAPGEKVGILGGVGSGKSTLLKLMAGLYKPQEGQILLDGLDMHHISRHLLSERLSYQQQHVRLFAGTLRENLLWGLSGIDDNRIMEVSEETGLSFLIAKHPMGLDLMIAEGGAGVSGGQKQLIAITRMILSRPEIWMLDEPSASMDDGLEQRVVTALGRTIKPEQTLVLVTHKQGLLALVDRLIILTPGGIAMDGPRDEVLRRLRGGVSESTKPAAQGGAAS